jgi:putative transposase
MVMGNGHNVSDQTVGNGISPAPNANVRPTGRNSFGLASRCSRQPTSSLSRFSRLVTYYVVFFIHLESRRVDVAGITAHPDEPWVEQIAGNATMDGWGGPKAATHTRAPQSSQCLTATPEAWAHSIA